MLATIFSAQARKFWVAVGAIALVGLTQLQGVLASGTVSAAQWVQIVIALIGAALVYRVPNDSGA